MAAAVSIWLRTEEEGDVDSEWQTDRQSAEEESKKNVELADRTRRSTGRFGIDTAKHHCTENGNISSVQDEQHIHYVPLQIRPKLALFASHCEREKAFT